MTDTTIPPLEERFTRGRRSRETFLARGRGDGVPAPRSVHVASDGRSAGIRHQYPALALSNPAPARAPDHSERGQARPKQEGRGDMVRHGATTLEQGNSGHHRHGVVGARVSDEPIAGTSGAVISGGIREIALPWWFWAGTLVLLVAGIIRMMPYMK